MNKVKAISRLKPLPNELLIKLYQVYVVPVMDYADIVWQVKTDKLDNFCNRMIKKVLHSRYSAINTLLPSARCCFHLAIYAYKVLNHLCPVYLENSIKYTSDVVKRTSGRNRFRAYVPQINNNYGKSSIYYRSVGVWNTLKSDLYQFTQLKYFKSYYKLHCF